MTNSSFDDLSKRMWTLLGESSRRASTLHGQFLHTRRSGLRDMQSLIAQQIQPGGVQSVSSSPRALFDGRQLDAFGTGKISDCLGPAFAGYDNRRIPRIPNGDLKMMSRIIEIHGTPRDFSKPASVVAEYDVPVDAWYLRDNALPEIPVSLWMEIALQPCGFLSAYLDTYALVPHGAFYFRNLDGAARLLARLDPRGQTIVTQAHMLTSVISGGTVVQKFAFELTIAGQTVYSGESTFGYFSAESMANQVGLDGGRATPPWLRAPEGAGQVYQTTPLSSLPSASPLKRSQGQLHFLDSITFSTAGGRYQQGYLYASRSVNPADWFFPFHFYQDPVMPGSLGVEAIQEALQAYLVASGQSAGAFRSIYLPANTADFIWRYRGQITPQHKLMELEAHVKSIERRADGLVLLADANLWVDGLRIYELKNMAIGLLH